MADDLRRKWKETGIGLGHAFRDLGKVLIKTGATAVKKADDWANGEDCVKDNVETEKDAPKPNVVVVVDPENK